MATWHRFRSAIATGVAMLLMQLAPLPVHAVNVQQGGLQILDPSGVCASWTWGGSPASPTVTCVAAAPPVAGAPVCTLTANPSSLSAAGTVTLTATCTNTDASTTWAWTGAGTTPSGTGASPQSQSLTVSGTTTFTVQATNGSGPSAIKSTTVTVGSPPPPPGGGLPATCGNYGVIPFNSGSPDVEFGSYHWVSSMSSTKVAVGRFTTGSASAPGQTATLNVSDGPSGWDNGPRKIFVGTTCDPAAAAYTSGLGNTVYIKYSVGTTVLGARTLQPNTTYYIMVTMPSCSAGGCGLVGLFNKP